MRARLLIGFFLAACGSSEPRLAPLHVVVATDASVTPDASEEQPNPSPGAGDCLAFTDEASCRASGYCHPVLIPDPIWQDCASTIIYWGCAEGRYADCVYVPRDPMCGRPAPCACGQTPGISIAYNSFCYEGCVRTEDCGP